MLRLAKVAGVAQICEAVAVTGGAGGGGASGKHRGIVYCCGRSPISKSYLAEPMQRSEDRTMWMVSPFQQFRSGSWLPWRIEDGFEAKEPSRAQGSNSLKASRSNPSRQKSQPRSFPMTTHAIQLTG